MGYLLLSSVLCLLALSATFTVCAASVAMLRATALRGRERLLCTVWKAALIFSLIPVNISLFFPARGHITAIVADRISQLTETYYELTGAEPKTGSGRGSYVVAPEGGSVVLAPIKPENAKLLIDLTPYACSSLLFLWFTVAAAKFLLPLREYAAGKKRLELYSMPYECGRARVIFDECAASLGLPTGRKRFGRRGPELMLVGGGRVCSPCVCGLYSPHVYIDASTASLSDEKLRYIFIHELSHIKLRHLPLKMLTNAVSAAHWFNPFAAKCGSMVACDCELACDRNVVERFGDESGDGYMITILEVARRICAVRAYAGVKTLGGGLFLSESAEKRFMERRYANMKQKPDHKNPRLAIALAMTVCVLFGAAAMASCGLPGNIGEGAAGSVTLVSYTTGSDLLDESIRAYYGINTGEAITAEMLDGIKTIELRASDMLAETKDKMIDSETYTYSKELLEQASNGVFVQFVINGRAIDLLETEPSVSRFEGTLAKFVGIRSKLAEEGSADAGLFKKWQAFYCKKDPADPDLDDDERARMIATYPETLINPVYMFDQYASVREKALLIDIAYKSGLLNYRYLEGGNFDASSLATLHNLKSAVFTGVNPVNFDDTLTVRADAETEYLEVDENSAVAEKPVPAPLSLTAGSALLDEGIRAYYGINAEEPITAELLSGIFTLKLSADTLTSGCFPSGGGPYTGTAGQIRQKLDNGVFLTLQINGKTIGVLETLVYRERFEGTILRALKNYADKYDDLITYEKLEKRWNSFYTYKDAANSVLTEKGLNELYEIFPETRHHKLYVLDPYMSKTEATLLLEDAFCSGLLENKYLPSGVFDVSVLDNLPKLISVTFEGVSLTGTCSALGAKKA